MNCSEFNRLLDNYENLNSDELDEMNNHAQNCESCKDELEFYRSIMLTAASLPVPEPPADLIKKVNSRIDNLPKYQSGFDKVINNIRNNTKRYASLAACIAVGVIVGFNSKTISNMLHPKPDYTQITPVVDVADADNTSQNTDDEPVIDNETNSTDAEPEPTAAEKENAAAPAANKTSSSESKQSVTSPKPAAANAAVAKSGPAAAAEKPQEIVAETNEAEPEYISETQAPTNGKTSKYTIARENYHIPTPSNEAESSVTEVPSEVVQVNPSERYQIAMGNYEIPEEEKKAIRNKLIVNEADIKEITECMNKAGIRGTSDGCEASVSAFSNFLAMLDARGIYYTYAKVSSDSSLVSFHLLAN
ncbi:MAG: hypothetical protein J1G06_10550 [Oscillospiraceae bacterium]|nr:hypothetical protein [Oscillospiraceae bacterium]